MTLKDGLVKQLTADIVSGKYKVGDSLPSERELSAMFGVSRTVVRVGLAELAA
ncbi:MAG: FadR family transcriptional regulator, partial [Oscillospiraceae bacterium]|nr:FadR family transcriptional regulator [Oscillospiraceae bacterium]